MKKTILLSLLMICATTNSGDAQTTTSVSPGATQQRTSETFQYYKLQKKLQAERDTSKEESLIDETKPLEQPSYDQEQRFEVKRIEVDSSSILTEQEINQIVRPLEGTMMSLTELSKVVEQINELYQSKDVITAQAILPPQKIKDGLVVIKLVEGRIGQILIEENKNTKDSYIKKRVSLKEQDLLNTQQLEKDIIFFNGTNDVKVRALLNPGEEYGTADITLQAFEPKLWDIIIFEDNAGREETGLYRTGLNITNNSVFGFRDRLTIGGVWAEGTADGYIAYNIPVTSKGTRFGFNYEYTETDIVDGPLESLDIEGKASVWGVSLTQPIIVEQSLLVNAFASYNIKHSSTEFSGVELFDTDVRSLYLGFDHTHLGSTRSLSLRHNFNIGFDEFGGDQSYFAYDGDYSLYQVLNENVYALLRSRLQFSDTDFMPSQEQFQIGGISSIRGYEEGFLIADNGYFLSAEINASLRQLLNKDNPNELFDKIRAFLFVDHGETFQFLNDSALTDIDDILTSVGFGITFDEIKKFSARLVLGIPLHHYNDNDDPRLHFHLQYHF